MPKSTARKYTPDSLQTVTHRLGGYLHDIDLVAAGMKERNIAEITVRFAGELDRATRAIKNFASAADDGLYAALEEGKHLGTDVKDA